MMIMSLHINQMMQEVKFLMLTQVNEEMVSNI